MFNKKYNRIHGGEIENLDKTPINGCAADIFGKKTVCSNKHNINEIKNFLCNSGFVNTKLSDIEVIETAKTLLGVNSEHEIYQHRKFRQHYGKEKADHVLDTLFVPSGPADSTNLLNDMNIDKTLEQWSHSAKPEFNKNFYNIPFQMIDFMKTGTELSRLDINKLRLQGYDCFGVVLNTDVSTGRGKHWFCIFGDISKSGTQQDPLHIEYFNSSGYPARTEVMLWMEKTCHDLRRDHGLYCEIINVVRGKQLQFSKTECGVWSLLYILSRLLDKPIDWIHKATDEDMIKMRKKLFRS